MSAHDGREVIYIFELSQYWASLKTKKRSVNLRNSDRQTIVRWDREWVTLHDQEELRALIQTEVIEPNRTLSVDGYQTDPRNVVVRPFVKAWEMTLGDYPTFGPGGH